VYEQPILFGLDYVWRLDDDSYLLDDVPYDVFRFMRERQLIYGYNHISWDEFRCIHGLWPAVTTYVKNNSIATEFFKEWSAPRMYYNNFEVSALSLWRSTSYQAYIEYIDSLGGFYYHRWGDAPVKTLAVSMFVPRNRTHQFSDISYTHQNFHHKPKRKSSV
jgi:hypothetical protein